MMKQLLFAIILLAGIASCKNKTKEKSFDTDAYQKTKETLAEKEKNSPRSFLVVSNHDRKNIIGQTVVKGSIANKATVCWYKDIQLHLSFFSKTGVKLDEAIETVYEQIPPGKSESFKIKYFAPKGTDSVAVSVVKATAEIVQP
jgi:hypothetical protein